MFGQLYCTPFLDPVLRLFNLPQQNHQKSQRATHDPSDNPEYALGSNGFKELADEPGHRHTAQ